MNILFRFYNHMLNTMCATKRIRISCLCTQGQIDGVYSGNQLIQPFSRHTHWTFQVELLDLHSELELLPTVLQKQNSQDYIPKVSQKKCKIILYLPGSIIREAMLIFFFFLRCLKQKIIFTKFIPQFYIAALHKNDRLLRKTGAMRILLMHTPFKNDRRDEYNNNEHSL